LWRRRFRNFRTATRRLPLSVDPGARIIVYQAPNTGQGWVDAFAAAIDANLADSFSTSWGNWEWFFANTEAYPAVIDPITGRTVAPLQAFHELLLRAAIQGQSASAGSGDGGGYDVVNDLGCQVPYSAAVASSCSATLTVDYPASDPLMTAGGGTTLPGQLQFCLNAACTPPYYDINIPHESVWGWDYLEGLCKVLGYSDPVSCGIFPWGGGGGVSIEFAEPLYQFGLNGIQLSQPGQAFSLQPYGLLDSLPAYYAGRNVPDVSFNADPYTGYIAYYTSDVHGFQVLENIAGTSAVAPQLNGVAALLDQYLNQRVGLLHIPLYLLVLTGQAYGGPNPPLHAIAYGDNWFYHGSNGYNLGAGLGTLDVANFANILSDIVR
jgi:kumamolisin